MGIEKINNIVAGVATNVAGTALMFLTTIYLTRTLETQIYGEFRLAFSFVSLAVILFVLGRDNGVVYFTQELKSSNKLVIIREESFYSFLTLTLGSVILYFLAPYFLKPLFNNNITIDHFRLTLLMIPLWGVFNVGVAGLRSLGYVNESFKLTFFIQRGLRALFFVGFISISLTFEALAWSMIVSQILLLIILCYKIPALLFDFKASLGNFFKRFVYSFQLGLSAIIFVVLSRLDVMMLGSLSTNENIAIYDVCILLTFVIMFPYTSLVKASEPTIKKMLVDNDILNVYRNNLKLAVVLSLIVLLPFIIAPRIILSVFGEEYKEGLMPLIVLSSGYALLIFFASPIEILNMVGSVRLSVRILIISIIINILLNYFFIPEYGLLGASIATIVSLLFTKIAGTIILINKYKLRISQYSFIKYIGCFIMSFGASYIIVYLDIIQNIYISKIMACTMAVAIYIWLVLLVDKELRIKLLSIIQNIY